MIVRAAKNAEIDPMMVLFTDDFLRSTSVFSFPFSFFWELSGAILPLVLVFLFFLVKFRKIPRPFVKKYGITLTFLSFSITNIVAFSSILLLQGKSICRVDRKPKHYMRQYSPITNFWQVLLIVSLIRFQL